MKSLIQACGSTFLVALDTHAFLIKQQDVVEELTSEESSDSPIQCVALQVQQSNVTPTIWCAVARSDKSLSLYCNGKHHVTRRTAKRASCLVFCHTPVDMIVVGDLVGDCTAYPLTLSCSRVLLGHTASMLTDVVLSPQNFLLTADRDEKVRISHFPQTDLVLGYLLGHQAYITSVALVGEDQCLTCSGDGTIRLWNLTAFEQVTQVDTNGLLPVQVACLHSLAAVVFHESLQIHVYLVDKNAVTLVQCLECPALPLGVSWSSIGTDDSRLLVLAKEPTVLQVYKRNPNDNLFLQVAVIPDSVTKLRELARSVTLPSSILETDSKGHVTLEKLQESRGPSQEIPWNRIERVQKARDSRSRRKKRKQES